MKLFKYILGLIFITGLFVSCSDDDYVKLDNSLTQKPVVTSPTNGTTLVLNSDAADTEAITITWNPASYSVNTPINYIIQIALGGTDFAAPAVIATTTEPTPYTLTVGQLNARALGLGMLPDVAGTLELRVIARLGDSDMADAVSETITLNVTPYPGSLDLSTEWGIVGSATPNGWDGPDVPFYKQQGADNSNILVAYTTLIDGEIKFRMNNSWDAPNINYGGSGGSLIEGGDNIAVTAGTYKITMNLNNLTYELEEFSLGIVGDATPNGWDGPDAQLLYDPTSDQFRTIVELTAGAIKFRLNDDWGTNWGGSGGVLEAGGGDIPVTAGKYVVTVNFNEMTYSLESIENIFGIVGDATPNGWDGPDVQLNIDYTSEYTSSGKWYISNVALVAGNLKFRADNDWAVNYGGSGLSGPLVAGGGDIAIAAAGNYDIVMDLSSMSYSITPSE